MNKLFSKIATLSVGLGLAIGVGVAVGSQKEAKVAKADYTYSLITSNTALSNGDFVVVATKDNNAPKTGVTGYNGNKDATVSADQALWVQFVVSGASADGWKLYDDGASKYIMSPSGNEFKYTAKEDEIGICSVSESGQLFCNNRVLSANGTNYRFYVSTSEYDRFYVWKVTGGSVVSYTITYDANGGTGEMNPTVGSNPAVVQCTFTAPTGKVFSKWNTAADGSGTDYEVGSKPGTDIKLYAIWVDRPPMAVLDDIGTNLTGSENDKMLATTITDEGKPYVLNYLQCKKQVQDTHTAIFMKKSAGAFISNHSPIPGKITSVEVFVPTGASSSTKYDVAFGGSEFTTATAGIGSQTIGANSSHVFESNYVGIGKFFCITLGNASNGQVYKIVVNYEKITYTAADFAQDLLGITDQICTGYDGTTNNKTILEAAWDTLKSTGYYAELLEDQVAILSSSAADESSENVVEKAMARYDYLTSKYALTSFISGRPLAPNQSSYFNDIISTSRTGIVVVIAIATTITLAIGLFFVLKKKKHN